MKHLARLHRFIERQTGVVFGTFRVHGHFPSGQPLDRAWLVVTPRRDGFAFGISVKTHGVYVDYVPRHEFEGVTR